MMGLVMNAQPRYRAQLIVRFGDIDQAGIVYYPRLVNYFHVAMEEFFAGALDLNYPRFLAEHQLGLPAARLEVEFLHPLRYGDHLDIEIEVESIGTTSIIWRYAIYRERGDEPCARARIVTVNVDMKTFDKTPVPDWLRDRLAPHIASA